LNNSVRHAFADEIRITVRIDASELEIIIKDNGVGFNNHPKEQSNGLGRNNLRERMNEIEGTIEWTDESDKGCTVRIRVHLMDNSSKRK